MGGNTNEYGIFVVGRFRGWAFDGVGSCGCDGTNMFPDDKLER